MSNTRVNKQMVNAFIAVANVMEESSGSSLLTRSLDTLWSTNGRIMAKILDCDTDQFENSQMLYKVLKFKLSSVNSLMAEDLNTCKAAEGDELEICKFYAVFLEHLRKEKKQVLWAIVDKVSEGTGENCLVDMFNYFDQLYNDDTVDGWWMVLTEEEEVEECEQEPSTPINESRATFYMTPINSIKRLNRFTTRSPIADAIDSPTMKYLRTDKELKLAKTKLSEYEMKLDEYMAENAKLYEENLRVKLKLADTEGDLKSERTMVNTLQEEVKEMRENGETMMRNLEHLNEKNRESAETIHNLNKQLSSRNTHNNEGELVKLKMNNDSLSQKVAFLEEDIQHSRESYVELSIKYEQILQKYEDELVRFEEEKSHLKSISKLHEEELQKANAETLRLQLAVHQGKEMATRREEELKKNFDKSSESHLEKLERYGATIKELQKDLEREAEMRLKVESMVASMEKAHEDKVNRLLDGFDQERKVSMKLKARFDALSQEKVDLLRQLETHRSTELSLKKEMEELKEKLDAEEKSRREMEEEVTRLKCQISQEKKENAYLRTRHDLMVKSHNERKVCCDHKKEEKPGELAAKEEKPRELATKEEKPRELATKEEPLREAVPKEEPPREDEKSKKPQNVQKSIAFDVNFGDENVENDPKNHRQTIAADFVLPSHRHHDPKETDEERINELMRRNKKCPPALRCSYATEVASIRGSLADESRIRDGTEKKRNTKRRSSLSRIRTFFA